MNAFSLPFYETGDCWTLNDTPALQDGNTAVTPRRLVDMQQSNSSVSIFGRSSVGGDAQCARAGQQFM
jgi:hypothetical protein